MSSQTIACPHCQKRYRLEVTESKVVQCGQCQKKFRVHPPQPVADPFADPFAEPVASQPQQPQLVGSTVPAPLQAPPKPSVGRPEPEGMGTGAKMLIVGLGIGFLLLMVGLAALLLWLMLGRSQDAVASGATGVVIAVADGGVEESSAVDSASGHGDSASASTRPAFGSSGTSSKRSKRSTSTSAAGDIAYDFKEGHQYTFRFDFEAELTKQNTLKMNGSNFLTKLPRGDLPLQVQGYGGISGGRNSGGDRQVLQSRSYTTTESKNSVDRYRFSSPKHDNFEGVVELDTAGQPKAAEETSNDVLPIIFKPMSRMGIDSLPPSGVKTWTDEREVITVRVEENSDPRYGPLASPFGGFSRHSPYGYPSRRPSASKTDVTTHKRTEKFEIESQDATQVRVKKTLSIVPKQKTGDGPQISLDAKGYYVFDKVKKCVVESKLTGTADLVDDNVSIKIPIKFSTSLSSVKTKAELAADREKREADRKKEKEELNKKNREIAAKGGSKDASEPLRFAAIEAGEGRVPNELVAEFPDLGWGVDSLAFSPEGILYAGKMDQSVLVFDVKKRKKIDEETKLDDLGQVKVTAVTPDGKHLLTGGYSGRIEVWKLREDGTLKDREAFTGHSKEIHTITISPDNKLAISGGRDKRARVWDIETRKEIAAFDGFKRSVLATYIADDGSYALATDGGSLMKIDLKTNKLVSNPKVFSRYPHAAAFAPDGKKLAVSGGHNVHLIDTTSFVEETVLEGPRSIHYGLVFGKDGKYLFAGGRHITQWDWAKGEAVNEYHVGDHATIRSIALTDDGENLASIGSSAGQDLRVFKIRNDSGK